MISVLISNSIEIRYDSAFWNDQGHELKEIGRSLGAGVLSKNLTSPKSRVALRQALATAPYADNAHELLPDLFTLASSRDYPIAQNAARAARKISTAIDPWHIEDYEINPSRLEQWRESWLDIALNTESWVDVRVISLEVALAFSQSKMDWKTLLSDVDPEFVRAVYELLPDDLLREPPPWLRDKIVGEDNDMIFGTAIKTMCELDASIPATHFNVKPDQSMPILRKRMLTCQRASPPKTPPKKRPSRRRTSP